MLLPLILTFGQPARGAERGKRSVRYSESYTPGQAPSPCLIDAGNDNAFVGCKGDCDGSGDVNIAEIIRIVDIVLGAATTDSCSALLRPPNVADVLQAANSALGQCPAVLRYRLTDDSKITYTPPPPGPSVEEPLTGSFTLVDHDRETDIEAIVFQITTFEFDGASFRIAPDTPGKAGCLRVFPGPVGDVLMIMLASIDGTPVILSGALSVPTIDDPHNVPSPLQDLKLCSDDVAYCVTIAALRDE